MARGVKFVRPSVTRRARPPRLGRSSERARENRDCRRDARHQRSTLAAACSAPSNAARRACRGRSSRSFLGRVVRWSVFRDPTRWRALRGARSRRRTKRLRSVTRLTAPRALFRGPRRRRLSNAFGRPSAARGSPAPDGRDDVHLQEGCARASREGGAQGERVRPRHRGGRGRSRHRRDRGQRAVRQVQEKRAYRGPPPRARRSNPTRVRTQVTASCANDYHAPFSSVASRRPRVPASPNAARAPSPRASAMKRAPRLGVGREPGLARAATGLGDAAADVTIETDRSLVDARLTRR